MSSYNINQYRTSKWQHIRSIVLERDHHTCVRCGRKYPDVTLNVHHIEYRKGAKAWEYSTDELMTLCSGCHAEEHGKKPPTYGWEYCGMEDLGVPAFKSLVQKGNVREVMCAYQRIDGDPCCGSNRYLQQILRDEWKFDGLVVSDCGAIGDFWKKPYMESRLFRIFYQVFRNNQESFYLILLLLFQLANLIG